MPEINNLALNRRLEEWKQRLIDLTRRNRLLYFQPTKGATLTISTPDISTIFARLYDEEKIWFFYLPPLPPSNLETDLDEIQETNEQILLPINDEFETNARANEIVCRGLSRKQLENKLKNLFRKARTDYQERGVRVLYLAFGTLVWRDKEKSLLGDNISPLILCPIDLRRESAAEPFELYWAEEDLILNPALITKLKQDFQLELPKIPDDLTAGDLPEYLSKISKVVKNLDWRVEPTVHLGLFSFHKLAIYQDLKENAGNVQKNLVIRGLAGEAISSDKSEVIPDEKELDSIQKPHQTFQILDADSSQQQTIQAALRGHNLVLHGPPGTGKSQTIANIIAEFLAHGKTVLFVSEKMAALEVVYKRLEDSKLSEYCLELHSHKANKREVITTLNESLNFKFVPRNLPQSIDYEKLSQTRATLNEYVQALHLIREPLGVSVRDVLSRVAQMKNVRFVPLQVENIELLDAVYIIERENLIKQLPNLWHIVEAGENFVWYGCRENDFEIKIAAFWERLLEEAKSKLNALLYSAAEFASTVGLDVPNDLAQLKWMIEVGKHLNQSPAPDSSWLTTNELDAISHEAENYREVSSKYWREHAILLENYEVDVLKLTNPTVSQLQNLWQNAIKRELVQPNSGGRHLISKRAQTVAFLEATINFGRELLADTEILRRLLELPEEAISVVSAGKIAELSIVLAELSESRDKPEVKWFEGNTLDDVETKTNRLRPKYEAYNDKQKNYEKRRAEILKHYDAGIFSLDLSQLIERFSSFIYRSPLRFLSPQFYRDKRSILSVSRSANLTANITDDLLEAREINRIGEELKAEMPPPVDAWGRYDEGAETDFGRIERAIAVAKEVLRLTNHQPSKAILQLVSQNSTNVELKRVAERIKQSSDEWRRNLEFLSDVIPVHSFSQTKLPLDESDLQLIIQWAQETVPPLTEMRNLLDAQLAYRKGNQSVSLGELLIDTQRRENLQAQQKQAVDESDRLQRKFGRRYVGLQTTWSEILSAIEWTNQMRNLFGSRPMSALFVENCTRKGEETPSISKTAAHLIEFQTSLNEILGKFEAPYPQKNGKRIDVCPFPEMEEVFSSLQSQIDELQNWGDYQQLKAKLEKSGLSAFVADLHKFGIPKTDFVQALRKSLYYVWLGKMFQNSEVLKNFRTHTHENLIAEFREVDKKLVRLSAQTIIEKCENQRPTNTFTLARNSEISILQREAAKKRRHLPVRDLFQTIPNLLIKLKPCLMMSPLSVSQFLPTSEKLKFDLVIFDEASQIFTEDAVGAIYRGSQLIVAGDNKQMPPTDFFRAAETDEAETETGEDALEQISSSADFASVLDEVQTIPGIAVQNLRWHYRSRHESLIAFSNNRFYGDKLVTFPAAQDNSPTLGVEFVYVPDGVYDRGGKRDNKREAEVIADLVFKHFLKYPKKSLGVVAFSQAQMTAIEDEIDRRTRNDRQYDEFFKDDRLEGFFVKNLENVQGDERDVIFFSVGYGRDAQGKLTMAFGPLNKDGGERRLNVAITRAREKVVLVSSIKAADLSLSATAGAGVLNFQRYLDYAERGTIALTLNAPQGLGEADSPLEEDIAAEIKSLGYDVVTQVGCSGYRIDIGVVDPLLPGRFLLGVEADGATYHSAYTARDRDRLRQQVLENLGWKIHRIWSPEWVGKRQTEIDRLKKALETARNGINASNISIRSVDVNNQLTIPIHNEDDLLEPEHTVVREQREIVNLDKPPEASIYHPCYITYGEEGVDSEFYRPETLSQRIYLLEKILRAESPVHIELATKRLVRAWCMERAAQRIMGIVRDTIRIGERNDRWSLRGDFLWLRESIEQAKNLSNFPVRVPNDYDSDTKRDVKFIASEEIQAAMLLILKHALSIEIDALMSETRRLFGFNRSGDNIRERLRNELETLKDKKLIEISDGKISLPFR